MNNVINFNEHIFPVGTVAFHPKYRSCKILEIKGMRRKIRYAVIHNEELIFKYVTVAFRKLIAYKIPGKI